MEVEHHPEGPQPQNLEKRPHESVGRWAERLLVVITGGERATRDEDRYGVDLWVTVQGFGDRVPIDLTLETDPDVIEKKHSNALKTGFVVFEATPAGVSIRDLKLAAQGGITFQTKILDALNAAITDWAKRLGAESRSFITRRELANQIAADEAEREAQKPQKGPRRSLRSRRKSYKRKKKKRRDKGKARGN